jgi:predicted transcriptional regulator
MLEIEEIKKLMADRNVQAVAKAVGLHPNAIYRLINGATYPKYTTVRILLDYLNSIK